MASWSQTFSVNNKYSLTLTVTEQSTDIGANTSTLAYSLVMATAPYSYTGYSDYRTTISCTINGSSVFSYNASRNFNASAAASYSETLCSGTTTVTHNADGTKTCAVAASVSVASGEYSPGSASISQSITLTTIPRASTCSWSGDFTIGSAKTITITRASSSFNHKLKFTVGSASETLPSGGTYASTSYSWTPASGTYSGQFPTQTSRTGTLVLYTYNSGTLIGSNSYTFTLKIPDAWKPSVSVSLSPSTENAFISGTGLYVAGYSAIKATITGTAATGAAISSYTISGAFSKTVNTSSASTVQTSGVIATSGSKSVTVTITDARGRTGSATASCSYTSYASPAVSALTYARGTYSGGVWTSSDTGEDLRIVFTGSCSLSGNGNTMRWSVGAPVTASGSGLTSGSSITQYAIGIGTVTAYTVTVTLTDAVRNSTTRSVFVPTIEMPFVIDPVLPALGVGAVPQTARTLELASNWQINPGAGIVAKWTTQDILTDALTMPTGSVQYYYGAGASYTGSVPGDYTAYKYGLFVAYRRSSIYCTVIAVPFNSNYGIGINTYNDNNSAWDGWQTFEQAGKLVTEDKTYSTATTLASGAHATVNITVTKAGYTPIGILGVTWSGSGYLSLCGYKITSSTNAALYVVNRGTSSQTANSYTATILYQRS